MDRLVRICTNLRKVLEVYNGNEGPATMKYFPKGSCQTTSLILASYIEKEGMGICKLVSGEIDGYSHAWLELNGVFIDITQDQFDWGKPIYINTPAYYQSLFSNIIMCTYKVRFEGNSIETDSLFPFYLEITNQIENLK